MVGRAHPTEPQRGTVGRAQSTELIQPEGLKESSRGQVRLSVIRGWRLRLPPATIEQAFSLRHPAADSVMHPWSGSRRWCNRPRPGSGTVGRAHPTEPQRRTVGRAHPTEPQRGTVGRAHPTEPQRGTVGRAHPTEWNPERESYGRYGIQNVTCVPSPTELSSSMRAFTAARAWRTMERPNPVPRLDPDRACPTW